MGDDRSLHALQESSRPATCDGDAGSGEFDLFHRSERLPVAVVTEGISALYDGAAVHVIRSRWVSASIFQEISTCPPGTDNAPNLVVLVPSSLNVIAKAITAPEVIPTSGPSIEKRSFPLLS